MSPKFGVRRIRAGEGARLRSIRLRALQDSPGSFGAVSADEEPLPPEAWAEIAERSARSDDEALFIAASDAGWVGMARVRLQPGDTHRAYLFGLWVEPAARHAGVATALIGAIAGWSRSHGALALTLWVVVSNTDAIALYRRLGFERLPGQKSMRRDPSIIEFEMVRRLD
ncbi:MAG: GNAT family N-acetyltransferase [Candidatus Limnocylindrales bacterium]